MATLSALVQELKALQSPSFFAVSSYTRGPQSSYLLLDFILLKCPLPGKPLLIVCGPLQVDLPLEDLPSSVQEELIISSRLLL